MHIADTGLDARVLPGRPEENTMAVQLNHTIVRVRDKEASARFLTEILGLPPAVPFGHFLVVEAANHVSLDYMQTDAEVAPQHYAFLISEQEFDEIYARIRERGIEYWADPGRTQAQQINRRDAGRGLYFEDPDGHLLEVITRPYGGDR
jgi:catechol 2,3-dioxygenase-like lactoylglutathione lyase family enzyme